MNTYPEMDAKIVGILRLSDEPAHLYAAQRIEELEGERDAFERDYTAVGERNKELHDMYFAALALAERRAGEIAQLRRLAQEWRDAYGAVHWAKLRHQPVTPQMEMTLFQASVDFHDALAAAPPPATEGDPIIAAARAVLAEAMRPGSDTPFTAEMAALEDALRARDGGGAT